jgi:hypothetical protein
MDDFLLDRIEEDPPVEYRLLLARQPTDKKWLPCQVAYFLSDPLTASKKAETGLFFGEPYVFIFEYGDPAPMPARKYMRDLMELGSDLIRREYDKTEYQWTPILYCYDPVFDPREVLERARDGYAV